MLRKSGKKMQWNLNSEFLGIKSEQQTQPWRQLTAYLRLFLHCLYFILQFIRDGKQLLFKKIVKTSTKVGRFTSEQVDFCRNPHPTPKHLRRSHPPKES